MRKRENLWSKAFKQICIPTVYCGSLKSQNNLLKNNKIIIIKKYYIKYPQFTEDMETDTDLNRHL